MREERERVLGILHEMISAIPPYPELDPIESWKARINSLQTAIERVDAGYAESHGTANTHSHRSQTR